MASSFTAMTMPPAKPPGQRSGVRAIQVPLAGWTAGLAAWRQGDPAAARAMFAQMSHGDPEDPLVAANAWWAARLSLLTGNPEGVGELLGVAARQSRSIYGLLARHALGMDAKLVNDLLPDLSDADLDALSGIPAMRRAVALAEVGQHHLGDREFNGLDVNRQLRNRDRRHHAGGRVRFSGDALPAFP